MKLFSRIILSGFMLMVLILLVAGCAPKKAEMKGEALKIAAKDFQPALMNLDAALKSGDIQAAKDTLALLSQKLEQIKAAEVPARLMENAEKVKSQVDALSTAMAELSTVLANPELAAIDSTVLNSFTSVRVNFARLGGLLRFKIPELIAFHDDVLHEIWHEAYPNDDIAAIKAAVPAFKEKAAALNKVQWPEALGDQTEAIKEKVAALQNAVNDLDIACQGNDSEAIKKATEEVHSLYEKIARML